MDSLAKYQKSLVKNLTQKPECIVDKLSAYYFDESGSVTLTPAEEKIRERYEEIFRMYSRWGSFDKAVRMFIKKTGISRAQAYRDLKNATRLFGEVKKVGREARKHILIEMGHEIYRLAKKEKDFDAAAKVHRNLIMLEGFDKEDAGLPDFSNFEQHTYNIVVDPTAVGLPSVPQILEQAGVDSLDELVNKFKVRKREKNILNIDQFQQGS